MSFLEYLEFQIVVQICKELCSDQYLPERNELTYRLVKPGSLFFLIYQKQIDLQVT